MHSGGRRTPAQAVELPPDEATAILRGALEPYPRSRPVSRAVRPTREGPSPTAGGSGSALDDAPEEFLALARRHPLFEH